jgi:trk system potassium uptake protein
LAKFKEPVVVIGLGRFGTAVSMELKKTGTEVLAIDINETTVQRMAGLLDRVVAADSTDLETLRELGVGDFNHAVVAIGSDQESSILTTSLLTDLGVSQIWAKALSLQHGRILTRVGAHHVVLPESEMGERLAHLISGELLDYLEIDSNWVIAKTRPPQYLVGVPLGETKVRASRGITVVSVKPEHDSNFRHADASTVLAYGDDIMIMGKPEDVERFVESR